MVLASCSHCSGSKQITILVLLGSTAAQDAVAVCMMSGALISAVLSDL